MARLAQLEAEVMMLDALYPSVQEPTPAGRQPCKWEVEANEAYARGRTDAVAAPTVEGRIAMLGRYPSDPSLAYLLGFNEARIECDEKRAAADPGVLAGCGM